MEFYCANSRFGLGNCDIPAKQQCCTCIFMPLLEFRVILKVKYLPFTLLNSLLSFVDSVIDMGGDGGHSARQ